MFIQKVSKLLLSSIEKDRFRDVELAAGVMSVRYIFGNADTQEKYTSVLGTDSKIPSDVKC